MILESWKEKTPQERQEARFERWRNPQDVTFSSDEVKSNYMARVNRVVDAITLVKTPDRVPTLSPAGFLPCFLYNVTCKEVMYDIDTAVDLWLRFVREYPTDLIRAPRSTPLERGSLCCSSC